MAVVDGEGRESTLVPPSTETPWKDTAIPQRSHTLIITSLRLVHTVHDLLGIHHTSARGRAKDDDVRPGRLLPPPPTDTRTRKMAKSCGQKLWQLVS